jgi:hypothetical protein
LKTTQGVKMESYERECIAEDNTRRIAEIEDEIRQCDSWDRGPHPMPIKLYQRRETLRAQLAEWRNAK